MKKSIALSLLVICGCSDTFEYSPNQRHDGDTPRNVNNRNLQRLQQQPADDTVRFVFIGDSQRFYDQLAPFVKSVNRLPRTDFVILAGDISDFGLLQELEWVNDELEQLKLPYFAVIGNHDVIGNGDRTFERFFGPLNYAFTYQRHKFVFHNTNGREYVTANVPDLPWLAQQLNDPEPEYFIGVSHVPPYDGDFARALEEPYRDLLSGTPNFVLSLHGHQHRFTDGYPYEDGVRYMTSPYFEERFYVLITLYQGQIWTERVSY
jgi:3',5'-cyclic AMP phosphodiesterase CpdA